MCTDTVSGLFASLKRYYLFLDIVLQKRRIFTPSRSLCRGVGYTKMILRVVCTNVLLSVRLLSTHDDSFLQYVLVHVTGSKVCSSGSSQA